MKYFLINEQDLAFLVEFLNDAVPRTKSITECAALVAALRKLPEVTPDAPPQPAPTVEPSA